jgi:hypothetical protein
VGEELITGWHSRRVPPPATTLRCALCDLPSDVEARGWLGRRIDVGGLPEIVFLCPGCVDVAG